MYRAKVGETDYVTETTSNFLAASRFLAFSLSILPLPSLHLPVSGAE